MLFYLGVSEGKWLIHVVRVVVHLCSIQRESVTGDQMVMAVMAVV
jgi:hypothetical protein